MEAECGFEVFYKKVMLVAKKLPVNSLLLIGLWIQKVQLVPCDLMGGEQWRLQTCMTPKPPTARPVNMAAQKTQPVRDLHYTGI